MTWIDKHSVNCFYCGNLVDERDCVPGPGEGDICPKCQKRALLKIEPELYQDLIKGNFPDTGENILEEKVEFMDGKYMIVYFTTPNYHHASLFDEDDTFIETATFDKFGQYTIRDYYVVIGDGKNMGGLP